MYERGDIHEAQPGEGPYDWALEEDESLRDALCVQPLCGKPATRWIDKKGNPTPYRATYCDKHGD